MASMPEDLDRMLMATAYNLVFLRCMDLRWRLLHVINAQNCLEKSVVSRLHQVHNAETPFELTDAFRLKFGRFEGEQIEQYLTKNPKSETNQFLNEDDQIEYVTQDKDGIPICLVRCKNRRDS